MHFVIQYALSKVLVAKSLQRYTVYVSYCVRYTLYSTSMYTLLYTKLDIYNTLDSTVTSALVAGLIFLCGDSDNFWDSVQRRIIPTFFALCFN